MSPVAPAGRRSWRPRNHGGRRCRCDGLREGPVHAELARRRRRSSGGHRGGGPFYRRSVLPGVALRDGDQPRRDHPVSRPRRRARRAAPGDPGVGGDDAADPGRRGARAGDGTGRGPSRRRRGRPRDRHRPGRRVVPSPRAIAIWGSCSLEARPRRRWNSPFAWPKRPSASSSSQPLNGRQDRPAGSAAESASARRRLER